MTATDLTPQTPPAPPLRRNRDFLLLWTGAGLTVFGARITALAYPLLVLWHTGSFAGAGLVGTAALLPLLLMQLPGGLLVDRVDRRRLMIWCDVGCLVATGSVAAAVLLGHVWLWQLVCVAFAQSSLALLYQLAERAAVRHLVTGGQLPLALSRNEARQRAAMLLGRPAGGALFELGRSVPFLATTATHLVSLVALLLIRRPFQARTGAPPRGTVRADLAAGLRYVWRQPFLRTVLLFVAVSNIPFEGLAYAVMAVVREDHGSPLVIGLILGVSGVGGIAGALHGTWYMRRAGLRTIVLGGLAGWAVVMPLFAFTRVPLLLGLLFTAMTYIGGVFNVVGGVYLVRSTPDHLMGRAGSVAMLLGTGTNFIGPILAGVLLSNLSVATAVLVLSSVMVLLVVVAAVSPAVRAEAGTRLVE